MPTLVNIYNVSISLVLAIITWTVLTYIHLIGGDYRSKQKDQNLEDELLPTYRDKGYDIYFNFLWIFACIYALSKITELTERYIGERIKTKSTNEAVKSINNDWDETLQVYELEKQRLAEQIEILRQKNFSLEKFLDDLKACNMELITENYRKALEHERELNGLSVLMQQHKIDKSLLPKTSNIFITNKHIHLTRQVFVNEGNINVNVRKTGGEEVFSEPAQVWVKYLKMRRYYMGPMADPALYMGDIEKREPLVLSTEQLSRLQGIPS